MAEHLVSQIVDVIVGLLEDNTDAGQRVCRDRDPVLPWSVDDLPAIDVRIGEDQPSDQIVSSVWRSDVEIYVDLYAKMGDVDVSRDLLNMRKQCWQRLIYADHKLPGISAVLRILPGGSDPIEKSEQASVPTGSLRTIFFVTYQHSNTDPSQ